MRKYEIIEDQTVDIEGRTLSRIRALRDFQANNIEVKQGDIGGLIESEENLSQQGNSWVADDAVAMGEALINGEAVLCNNAKIWGDTLVSGRSIVRDNAVAGGEGGVIKDSVLSEDCIVISSTITRSIIMGHAHLQDGNSLDEAKIEGNSVIKNSEITRGAMIAGTTTITSAEISGGGVVDSVVSNSTLIDCIVRESKIVRETAKDKLLKGSLSESAA